MKSIPTTDELFDIGHTLAAPLLEKFALPYLALSELKSYITSLMKALDRSFLEVRRGVFVAADALLWDGVTIKAPAIIGHKTEIRPGAVLRGCVIVGDGALIGSGCEAENSIILDEARLYHNVFLSDSIIGYRADMGSGAACANERLDKRQIILKSQDRIIETGTKKLGAMLGDYSAVGCGAVLCPGAVIGRECVIYPNTVFGGILGERCAFDGKSEHQIDK